MLRTPARFISSEAEQTGQQKVQEWVQAALRGDLEAFNQLVLAFQDDLFSWVYHLVSDPSLADDITQWVFITAYQKLNTFRNGSFRGWLFQIAKNRSYDEIRRQQRHPMISLQQPIHEETGGELQDWIQDSGISTEGRVEQQERANAVHQLLAQLPEEHRQVLLLIDLNELNYKEAAEVLRVPVGTVKSRLARARNGFRKLALRTNLPIFSKP
jgi:RNA polymerase sigma-70 factor (ECF subfamily)